MELPKNITQIGEANPHCKIYVEDYVISYVKQMNQHACDKMLAVALYGIRKEEEGITYLFLYGACKLNFLQRECRHLSQAVQQEIEKQRRKYFPEFIFLGYRLLDGEMVEGFHICEQDVCRYVEGYARFYEKNDSMLSFMLEERQGETKPEEVNQEKYDAVKKRQEERRALAEEKGARIPKIQGKALWKKSSEENQGVDKLRNMKLTAAAVFVLLCVAGLSVMSDGERLNDLRTTAQQFMEGMTQQQLPDAMEVANNSAQTGVIVTEDKLTDAILKENAAAGTGTDKSSEEQNSASEPSGSEPSVSEPPVPESSVSEETRQPEESVQTPEPTQEPVQEPTPEPDSTEAAATAPISYTVQRGDTLIGICIKKYGSASRLSEICTLNDISDPDHIKEGAQILLPQ